MNGMGVNVHAEMGISDVNESTISRVELVYVIRLSSCAHGSISSRTILFRSG